MFDLPPPDPAIELSVATRGYSKGIAQTEGPQLLVRPELQLGPALLSVYAKNVTSPTSDGEAGISGGYRFGLAGLDVAATVVVKTLLDPSNGVDATALELIGGLSRTSGPFSGRLNYFFSPDELGTTRRSHYLEGSGTYGLGRGFSASAGLGVRRRVASPNYVSYNAGASYKISDQLTADLRWFGNDRSELGAFFKDRLVGTLRARF
ncbi:TorF family putative porin [uncultured Sphingomonas sp.]|uniref:TorF family putative porin n=1 Tax=uncultured Sphingomonas sp. TaxID=158754 RepID=UPI0025F9EC70|nr:TorF family putative porin [uncultured Sphingomonas sp.]